MDKYTLKIESQHGTITIPDLEMNGTNYVSETQVDTSAWPDTFKLTVTDKNGNITEQYDHAKLIQQEQYAWDNNRWYLAFAPVSAQEIKNAELQSQLEYLAMMADVDLEV
jgi:aconitase A